MCDINAVFSKTLWHFLKKAPSKRKFADEIGVSAPYLSDLLGGRRFGDERTKRKIAAALGFPGRHFEDFLDIGRVILDSGEDRHFLGGLPQGILQERGFFQVDYSEKLLLGPDMKIEVTAKKEKSPVIVHNAVLGRRTVWGLQAFKVPDNEMYPVIAKDSIIIADINQTRIPGMTGEEIFVIYLENLFRQCQIRYLAEVVSSPEYLSVRSENRLVQPLICRTREVLILGRVIMMSRVFS
ncbi:MAG: XRE family transcriptional regulator [Deltaproteobacteria bacterium]|nr:XRE family transcriptional regulator [Deltaproteobacteria bacterium]